MNEEPAFGLVLHEYALAPCRASEPLPAGARGQALSAEPSILAPLAGRTWVGSVSSADGERTFAVACSAQVLWDGSVVVYTRMNGIIPPASRPAR